MANMRVIRLEAVAQPGDVGWHLDLHARHGRAVERALVRALEPGGAERARALRVGFPYVEMRPLAIVAIFMARRYLIIATLRHTNDLVRAEVEQATAGC